MTSSARDRAIEAAPEKMLRHHAEAFVDALLANPGVLRALADQATPDTSDAPKVWWSPSLTSKHGHPYTGMIWKYVSGQGFVTPDDLPADAVRLVPAAATTPTDDGAALDRIAATLENLSDPDVRHGKWILGKLAADVRAALARRSEETRP